MTDPPRARPDAGGGGERIAGRSPRGEERILRSVISRLQDEVGERADPWWSHRLPPEAATVAAQLEGLIRDVRKTEEGQEEPSTSVGETALSLSLEEERTAAGQTLLRERLLALVREGVLDSPLATEDPAAALRLLRTLARLDGSGRTEGPEALHHRLASPDSFDRIAEVAHDLRSPLTSILFMAETLRGGESGAVDELQRRQLGLIYSAALGMVSIVTDFMELAGGGVRLAEEEPVPIELAEVFETVGEVLYPMAEVKGVKLLMRNDVRGARMGFPHPLSRVLLNLATNGLKFTDEGMVEVRAEPVGTGDVLFSVRDTGPGIDPSEWDTLFEPFRSGPRRDGRIFSGSGLGLSIARRLVEALGGELAFRTGAEEGTRFHFRLHLPPPSAPDA